MKRFGMMATIVASLSTGATSQSIGAPLDTMDEVGAAIMACWHPPAGTEGSVVTLSFSFNRDGALIGPPAPTDINVAGDDQARQAFVEAATDALENCIPLSFSPALAAGIAGNPFTMQFSSPGN